MNIEPNNLLLPGQVVLKRGRDVVWVGPLAAPWEDVDCDTAIVSPGDYEAILLRTLPHGVIL